MQTFDGRNLKTPSGFAFAPKNNNFTDQPSGLQTITLGGDATGIGTAGISVTVVGIYGHPVPTPGATAGNLRWNGTAWTLDTATYLSSITSSMVTTVLGFTPLSPGGALGTPASGNLVNCTFPTLNQNTTGSAASATNLTGTTQPATITWDAPQVFNSNVTSGGNFQLSSTAGLFYATARFGGANNGQILCNNSTGANFVLAETATNVFAIGTAAAGAVLSSITISFNVSTQAVTIPGTLFLGGGSVALNKYDEGTWTPTPSGLGGTGITYVAKWIRVGNRVDFTITINGTGLTSTVASTTVSLAFTAARDSVGVFMNGANNTSPGPLYIHAASAYLPTQASTTQMILSGTIFLA